MVPGKPRFWLHCERIKVRNLFKLTSGKAHIGTHHREGSTSRDQKSRATKKHHMFFWRFWKSFCHASMIFWLSMVLVGLCGKFLVIFSITRNFPPQSSPCSHLCENRLEIICKAFLVRKSKGAGVRVYLLNNDEHDDVIYMFHKEFPLKLGKPLVLPKRTSIKSPISPLSFTDVFFVSEEISLSLRTRGPKLHKSRLVNKK